MKKIINGRTYNTETATEVSSYSNGGNWRDFNHYEESLYRKRTGEFFLYGRGGPLTKYAVSCENNMRCSGSRIEPLTEDAARAWMERYSSVNEYVSVFGEPEE